MYSGPLQPLRPQTHVDLMFGFVTHADCFVEETAGVTFVEGVHDFFAAYIGG